MGMYQEVSIYGPKSKNKIEKKSKNVVRKSIQQVLVKFNSSQVEIVLWSKKKSRKILLETMPVNKRILTFTKWDYWIMLSNWSF